MDYELCNAATKLIRNTFFKSEFYNVDFRNYYMYVFM